MRDFLRALTASFFFWGGGLGGAQEGTDKACQLITNVMTTLRPITLDFR